MTRRQDFTLAVRAGRRAGRGTLVVHLVRPEDPSAPPGPARVGFVVGRTVGGSVDRHRVIRRLRHLVRDRLEQLPAGAVIVVRALPAARDADAATLGQDLDAALRRLLGASGAGSGRPIPAMHGAGPGDPPTHPTHPTHSIRATPPVARS